MSADLERVEEALSFDSTYAPALRVLMHDQACQTGRDYIKRILKGEALFWDLPPLAKEDWKVYASIGGFYAQALRLFGADVGLDVWPDWNRSRWITADWNPLSREFGWKIACRPLEGVRFRESSPSIEASVGYLSSWPHGWLSLGECVDYAPALHHLLVELAEPLELSWSDAQLDKLLYDPRRLSKNQRFELNNRTASEAGWAWQFQRGVCLLGAMRAAIEEEKDLVSVGF